MHSDAKTVQAYLKESPPERKTAIEKVRAVIRKNLPQGYEEVMNWGHDHLPGAIVCKTGHI